MATRRERQIIETPTEARQAEPGPSILALLMASTGLAILILGETLEQKRFFEQALAGRHDLLGRRTEDVGPLVGKVLPTRWVE